jgi:hypothetical protein
MLQKPSGVNRMLTYTFSGVLKSSVFEHAEKAINIDKAAIAARDILRISPS